MQTKTVRHLLDLIKAVAGKKPISLSGESAIGMLGLDSLDEVELLMSIEDHFGIELDQAEVYSCSTIEQLASLIDNKLARNS